MDVHPPFYYLILKVGVQILSPFFDCIVAAKLISIIPYFILMILGFTVLRTKYGDTISFLFNVAILGMPRIMEYAIEIRMYSFGMLFVFCTFLFATKLVDEPEKKQNYIGLTIFAILSSYIHYFACASEIVIYIFVLLVAFRRKEYKRMKYVFFSGLVVAISYLPWLFVFFNQVATVKNDYWISPITLASVIVDILFMFLFNSNFEYLILTAITFSIFILGLNGAICLMKKKNTTAVFGITVLFGTLVLGIILSLIIRPIFFPRYLMSASACMWLGIILGLSNVWNKKNFKIFLMITFICVGFACNGLYTKNEIVNENNVNSTNEKIESYLHKNTIIITNDTSAQQEMAYLHPQNELSIIGSSIGNKDLTVKVYSQCKLSETNDLMTFKNYNSNILVLDNTGNLTKELKNFGYPLTKITDGKISADESSTLQIFNIE